MKSFTTKNLLFDLSYHTLALILKSTIQQNHHLCHAAYINNNTGLKKTIWYKSHKHYLNPYTHRLTLDSGVLGAVGVFKTSITFDVVVVVPPLLSKLSKNLKL